MCIYSCSCSCPCYLLVDLEICRGRQEGEELWQRGKGVEAPYLIIDVEPFGQALFLRAAPRWHSPTPQSQPRCVDWSAACLCCLQYRQPLSGRRWPALVCCISLHLWPVALWCVAGKTAASMLHGLSRLLEVTVTLTSRRTNDIE